MRPSKLVPGMMLPDLPSRKGNGAARHKSPKPSKPALGDGPGTELLVLWDGWNVKRPKNCTCDAVAADMNAAGVEGSKVRRGEFIGRIEDNKDLWTWGEWIWSSMKAGTLAIASGIIPSVGAMYDEAIRRAEVKEGEKKNRLAEIAAVETIRPEPLDFRLFAGKVDPTTFFAGVYVISLDRTPDRLRDFRQRLTDWPFAAPEHVAAVDGRAVVIPEHYQLRSRAERDPAYGCLQSHLGIVRRAIDFDRPILILEDDCEFVPGAAQKLTAMLEQVPANADLFYVGGQLHKPFTRINSELVRADSGAGRTHAYVVYPRFFRRMTALLKNCAVHIDWELRRFAKDGKLVAYAASPVLAIQRANVSTIIPGRSEPARSWDVRAPVRPPRTLLAVVCHDRLDNLAAWLRAWKRCEHDNATLYIVSTGNLRPGDLPPDTELLMTSNIGFDIGAIQRFIQAPPEPYELLMWCPDDFLPMRPDFLDLYRQPFDGRFVGMVGTWWGTNHVRSGGVCVHRELAESLRFPPDMQSPGTWQQQRKRCLRFEHGDYSFYDQVVKAYPVLLADGSTPPSSPFWEHQSQHHILWDKGDKRRWMNYPVMQAKFDMVFPTVT